MEKWHRGGYRERRSKQYPETRPPMPPSSSHVASAAPSALLALLCASIVKDYDPSWISASVKDLAGPAGVRPERVSRLKAKLLAPFRSLLEKASRRGRPKRRRKTPERGAKARAALLLVAAEVVGSFSLTKRRTQDFVVAARDRLKVEEGISHREFCAALGLEERTVRYWARRGAAPKEPPGPPPPPPPLPRCPGRGRFDLEVTLPGIQAMADTSDFALFDVPLKIVALQDPGSRREKLWEAFALDDHEDHEVVVKVVAEALGDRPGTQLVTDQGTPYLAEAAQNAYDEIGISHAPQKEGDPTKKATLERSFRTVKDALAPLTELSGKLARAVPALRDAGLAKALGRLLLATFLRVYVAARDAPAGDRPADPVVLEALACAQRERAWGERQSAKLLLESVHDRYQLHGQKRKFVKAHRHHRVEDIEEAERRMGWRACRCQAKVCDRYFAAILNAVANERRPRRLKDRRQAVRRSTENQEKARLQEEEEHQREHVESWIATALGLVAAQYLPDRNRLFNEGLGLGTRQLREALDHLERAAPLGLLDRAEVGWRTWLDENPDPKAVPLVREVFNQHLRQCRENGKPLPSSAAAHILATGPHPQQKPRPPPEADLRF